MSDFTEHYTAHMHAVTPVWAWRQAGLHILQQWISLISQYQHTAYTVYVYTYYVCKILFVLWH